MAEYASLELKVENNVGHLVLNRPESLNAVSPQILSDLDLVCGEIESNKEIRAVVLSGAGKSFCAGADLKHVMGVRETPGGFEKFARYLNKVFNRFEELPVPTIAAIQGYCFAGGLELALCCDIRIVADDVTIGDQHANFGLLPGGGGTQRLPRLIGASRAKEILLLGSWLKAGDAEKIGLANRVAPLDELLSVAGAMATELASKSAEASRAMKSLVDKGMQVDLRSGLEMEQLAVIHMITTAEDAAEGLDAFSNRRKPSFGARLI